MPDDDHSEEQETNEQEVNLQEEGVGEMFDFAQGLSGQDTNEGETESAEEQEETAPEEEEEESTEEKPEEEEEESADEQEDQDGSEEAEGEETEEPEGSEEEAGDEEGEDEHLEEDEEDEDPRDTVIAKLKERLDKLEGKKSDEKDETEDIPIPGIPEDFQAQIMGDLELDDIISDPELFVQVLQKAITVGRDLTHEYILKSLPNVVMTQTRNYQNLQKLRYRFYKQNKDLKGYKNAVAEAANEIYAEEPDLSFERVMEKAATRTRKALGLKKKAMKQKPPGKNKGKKKQTPAFAKTPKGKEAKKQVSKMQSEINDLM